jgi:hypothetical protein
MQTGRYSSVTIVYTDIVQEAAVSGMILCGQRHPNDSTSPTHKAKFLAHGSPAPQRDRVTLRTLATASWPASGRRDYDEF